MFTSWLDEIAKTGVVSDMGAYIDEAPHQYGGTPTRKRVIARHSA